MKKSIFGIFTFCLTYGQFVSDSNFGFSGGPNMNPEQQSNQPSYINVEERAFINKNKLDILYRPSLRATLFYLMTIWVMVYFFGDDQYITNYVDEDPSIGKNSIFEQYRYIGSWFDGLNPK